MTLRSALDFSSWQALASTLFGLAVISLVAVGIRLLLMQTVQRRRERQNRQINERLRTLIAAYKTLGGSFTGSLEVDPSHRRDFHGGGERDERDAPFDATGEAPAPSTSTTTSIPTPSVTPAATGEPPGSERRRRVRDAVEAALSDVILLGTEEQVHLAAKAAGDLAAGRAVETAAIVVSLRNFIREVLDLEPVPTGLTIPRQGPVRPAVGAARGSGRVDAGNSRGGSGGGGGAGGGGGGGGGMGTWTGATHDADDSSNH